jgi:hypothetical protein
VRPTRVSTLLAVAVVAGALAYLLVRAGYSSLPPLPWTAALSTFVLAVAEAFLAPSVRARLAGRPGTRPILPLVVARTAALAKASSVLGALLLGGWLGMLAYVVPRDVDATRRDTPRVVAGAVTALALVGAALWLENVCRVPKPPDREPPPAEPGP